MIRSIERPGPRRTPADRERRFVCCAFAYLSAVGSHGAFFAQLARPPWPTGPNFRTGKSAWSSARRPAGCLRTTLILAVLLRPIHEATYPGATEPSSCRTCGRPASRGVAPNYNLQRGGPRHGHLMGRRHSQCHAEATEFPLVYPYRVKSKSASVFRWSGSALRQNKPCRRGAWQFVQPRFKFDSTTSLKNELNRRRHRPGATTSF